MPTHLFREAHLLVHGILRLSNINSFISLALQNSDNHG